MSDLTFSPGQSVPVVSCVDTDIVVSGNWTNLPAFAGKQYCFRYRFSPQFLRAQESNSASIINDGRLQLRRFIVNFNATQHFKIEVTPAISGTLYTYAIGDDNLLLDSESINLQNGDYDIPIMAEHDKVQIDLVNCSPFPSNFLAVSFTGEYAPKARRYG